MPSNDAVASWLRFDVNNSISRQQTMIRLTAAGAATAVLFR